MRKLSELKPFDRVKVQYYGRKKDRINNTEYVDFDKATETHAYFDCDNGLDKYCIEISKIIRID